MNHVHSRKKWSIVVTVMLLMVVSSFIMILTMRYVLSMLSWFVSLNNYYKAYYLARGSMDVLLTQHSYRGWWYETQIASNGEWFLCAWQCTVAGGIVSRFPRVDASNNPKNSTCSVDTAISINPGQSAIYALFADEYQLSELFVPLQLLIDYQSFPSLKNIDMHVYDNPKAGNLYWYDSRANANIWWVTTKFDTIPLSVPNIYWEQIKTNILYNVPNAPWVFLIVHNPSLNDNPQATPFRYCFSTPNKNMIWQTNIINVSASVADAYVTMETVKTNRFPSILIQ